MLSNYYNVINGLTRHVNTLRAEDRSQLAAWEVAREIDEVGTSNIVMLCKAIRGLVKPRELFVTPASKDATEYSLMRMHIAYAYCEDTANMPLIEAKRWAELLIANWGL